MERERFIDDTVEWLNRRVAPAGVVVDADTRLFDDGIVDSLGILRLIAWTERATGRRIENREIRMDRFGSVRDIAESFAGGSAGGSAGRRGAAGCGGAAEPVERSACVACGRCARRAA